MSRPESVIVKYVRDNPDVLKVKKKPKVTTKRKKTVVPEQPKDVQ